MICTSSDNDLYIELRSRMEITGEERGNCVREFPSNSNTNAFLIATELQAKLSRLRNVSQINYNYMLHDTGDPTFSET